MNMDNKELLRLVRQCLANTELMTALRELLARADADALQVLRGSTTDAEFQEARETLRANERVRYYFRVARKEKEKDPFHVG
jgi:hypothetical protein